MKIDLVRYEEFDSLVKYKGDKIINNMKCEFSIVKIKESATFYIIINIHLGGDYVKDTVMLSGGSIKEITRKANDWMKSENRFPFRI